ncbi:hypothetical protein [Cryptosporangium aurantiacum]|uniref:Uncharacterized protein n=1 Tax=Cryptosporangium aurantiacum TaxID=134849 RepID=A0A1M7RK95_9ACTN|nr:hypothetical protein [Cryptosporangium aurantiacum]SHN46684.1 hypothetical protein SAMN05443668_11767 [Cryptosporangium aurantiacum]
MTDDDLDRMIRDADPYRPPVSAHLDGAAQSLLEEIVSVPVSETPAKRRRRFLVPIVAGGVAAATLAGVFALTVPDASKPESRPVISESTPVTYSALVLKAAEDNPRLLIDEPGWKATYVTGFAEAAGSIRWEKDGRSLEINWRPAAYYDDYHEGRLQTGTPARVTIDGRHGELFQYTADDFGVMLPPRDSSFVEMLADGNWTRASLDRVLALVKHVDVRTWLAALPPEIVTPDRIDERAQQVLTGVPLPPGFDAETLKELGTNDPYQFGAAVASKVGCAWIAEWQRATKAGDAAAVKRAADALRGSHDWKFLKDMAAEGDYPEIFWEIVDEVAAGTVPEGYDGTLGCAPN